MPDEAALRATAFLVLVSAAVVMESKAAFLDVPLCRYGEAAGTAGGKIAKEKSMRRVSLASRFLSERMSYISNLAAF